MLSTAPDFTLRVFFNSGDADGQQQILAGWRQKVGWLITAITCLLPVILTLRAFSSTEAQPFKSHDLVYRDEDLDLMLKAYSDADKIVIISGDYSFLGKKPELCRLLYALSKRQRLTLLSYKTTKEVEEATQGFPEAGKLYEALLARDHIHFNFPIRQKLSLIRFDTKVMLMYRRRIDLGQANQFRMVFVNPHPESDYLLSYFEQLIEELILSEYHEN